MAGAIKKRTRQMRSARKRTPSVTLRRTSLPSGCAAVGQLPRRQAQVFCLTCFEQMSSNEVAERLRVNPTAVRMLLSRARTAARAPGATRRRIGTRRLRSGTMEDHKDLTPDDLLDRAVDAVLRDPMPGELPPDRIAQLVAAVEKAANRPYPVTLIERIRNMKLRTKIAIAASILIACAGLMSWLAPGSGVAVAFADVADALSNVHTATWKTTSVVEDQGA